MATDNHNFSQPARGAENWDQDWYDNFDALDERVVLRGPAADRNNYTGYADALYFATDTEEVYEGTGSGWSQLESFGSDPTLGDVSATSVGAGSATITNGVSAGSVDADDVTTDTLDATEPSGGVQPAGKLTFTTEFVGNVIPSATHDPELVSRRHFDDGLHRVITGNSTTDETYLHTTEDFTSFTQVATDILPNVAGTGQVAGATILNDGRAIFLRSSDTATDLYVGSDFTSLSLEGQFCPEPDGGLFYDRATGTLHYYPEDVDTAAGVSSTNLSHWTASDDDLLNATQQADALDTSAYSWDTGDPHVIQVGDWYYMFVDNTLNHPTYRIALAVGETLDSFEIVNENITPEAYGGDITIVQHGGYFEALTEYSQDENQIGHWRLWPAPLTELGKRNEIRGTAKRGPDIVDGTQDKTRVDMVQRTGDEWSMRIHQDPELPAGSSGPFGLRFIDSDGSEIGNLIGYNGGVVLQGTSGHPLGIGIPGSGQLEMEVAEDKVSFGKFINMAPQSSPPSTPTTNDIYLDDGTNRGDASEGFRRYDGAAWVDIS